MLIQHAETYGGPVADVRIEHGRIAAIGALTASAGEVAIDADGGALLPGLHDHHLHLLSFAAALDSVACGPPVVTSERALIAVLRALPARAAGQWVRGIGYHEGVAGDIDRHWLDRHVPHQPVRIQHRSGRLWILNSAGVELLANAATTSVDGSAHRAVAATRDGRFFDQDQLLGALVGPALPAVEAASRRLASFGVTGVTDMTPRNNGDTVSLFKGLQRDGALLQRVLLAGTAALHGQKHDQDLLIGPTKVHLHESALPPFADLIEAIMQSHRQQRTVAVHCVTEVELVFALAAFREAGPLAGDRIEHASVTPPALLDQLRELRLTVVTQPNFVTERGDAYLTDVPTAEHNGLYRCRSFIAHRIPLAGGTDAPFGDPDPWRAMHAAVTRRTASGATLGSHESLTPEQALALFLGPPHSPATPSRIALGGDADLCLLDRPWAQARTHLNSSLVRATLRHGQLIYDRVNQSPR